MTVKFRLLQPLRARGAALAFGEVVAALFVAESASVILTDIDEERGHAAVERLGGTASFQRLDAGDEADCALWR